MQGIINNLVTPITKNLHFTKIESSSDWYSMHHTTACCTSYYLYPPEKEKKAVKLAAASPPHDGDPTGSKK